MTARLHHLLIVVLGSSACLANVAPDVGELAVGECDPEDHDPGMDVDFEMDVLPLLQERCSCHDPDGPFPSGVNVSGFSIENYRELLAGGDNSGEDIVVPGDPCASVLIQKVGEAPPFGSRMPQFGPYLSDDQREMLHDWIAEGAKR